MVLTGESSMLLKFTCCNPCHPGNVQVDAQHLTLGRDMIIPQELTPGSVAAFKRLASAIHDSGHSISPLAIMQLSHAGRQSPRIVGGRSYFEPPHAPSAVPLRPKEGTLSSIFYRLFFAEPKAMTDEEVDVVKEAFVRGAMLAQEAGFDGAQIHCSHGCKHIKKFFGFYSSSNYQTFSRSYFTVLITSGN